MNLKYDKKNINKILILILILSILNFSISILIPLFIIYKIILFKPSRKAVDNIIKYSLLIIFSPIIFILWWLILICVSISIVLLNIIAFIYIIFLMFLSFKVIYKIFKFIINQFFIKQENLSTEIFSLKNWLYNNYLIIISKINQKNKLTINKVVSPPKLTI
ncbi:hypothetical protein SCANT_v1c04280 [Spiroplasma cantharicola]|uniref:Transmembrane protein n=1 Tax=Spiroplasma cantharicola TaxID=362837 RepID=A0A0M3SJ93_9MOLU|nr:hypothetical protein SCANT_v1c04280 [Spiroplasma cantharicola]